MFCQFILSYMQRNSFSNSLCSNRPYQCSVEICIASQTQLIGCKSQSLVLSCSIKIDSICFQFFLWPWLNGCSRTTVSSRYSINYFENVECTDFLCLMKTNLCLVCASLLSQSMTERWWWTTSNPAEHLSQISEGFEIVLQTIFWLLSKHIKPFLMI